jgi:hypothetical protein
MPMLQEMIVDELTASNAGEIDGHEFGDGEFEIFIDGKSVEEMWQAV